MILRRSRSAFLTDYNFIFNILQSRIPCNYSQLTHNHDNLEEDEQQQKANLRIGRAVRNIPEDYRHFFTRPGSDVIDFSPYDPNCKLILHVENILTSSTTSSASTSTSLLSPTTTAALLPEALEIEGKRAMRLFLWRIRFLWKWGHLFWILSDWQALKMEPIRIINPTTRLKHQNELKIYWQLSVDPTRAVFINKKISLKSLYKVQMARIFGDHHHHSSHHTITDRETITSPPIILMSGLNRYIFDLKTGYCTELHIDSVEPKIDRSKWATWLENNLSEPATV